MDKYLGFFMINLNTLMSGGGILYSFFTALSEGITESPKSGKILLITQT